MITEKQELYKDLVRTIKLFDGNYKMFQHNHKSFNNLQNTNVEVINWIFQENLLFKNKIISNLADYYWNYKILKDTAFYNQNLCVSIRKNFYEKKLTHFLKNTDKCFEHIPTLLNLVEENVKN